MNAPHASAADGPTLVGRSAALDQLAAELDLATSEGGRAVIVSGEAGIGKTALLDAFAARARARGTTVLVGATASMDRAVPYAPIAQAVRQLLRGLDDPRQRQLLGAARTQIARLVPSLGLAGSSATTDEPVGDEGRLQLHAALLDLLERAASPSLVLVVEDVHWADPSTLDLLSALLSGLTDLPVLILLSFRTDEVRPTHPVRAVLLEWERSPRVRRLELGRLTDADLHHVIAPIVGDDAEVAEAAVRRAGGNAFVALELARAGAEGSLPEGLRDAVLVRLGRLEQTTQELVRAAAAGGIHVQHDLLASVVDLRPSELRPALREAIAAHFLVAEETGYRFRHALMAEVLHDDLLPGERREVHGRYAKALDDEPSLMPHGRWTALAEHRLAANDLDGAFTASLEAARESLDASAMADAAAHFARAADLWDTVPSAAAEAGVGHGQLLLRAAQAAAHSGQPTIALAHADRAVAQLEREGDQVGSAMALRWRGAALYGLGRPGMQEAYREALDRLPPDAHFERATVLHAMAKGHALLGHYTEAEPLVREALALFAEHGDEADVLGARHALAMVVANLGHADEALAIYDDLLSGDLPDEVCCTVQTNYGDLFDLLGRPEDALRVTLAGIDDAARRPLGYRDLFLVLNAAEFNWKLGRLDEARSWLSTAARPADGVGRLHRVLCVARLRLERDGPEAAAAAIATAARLGDSEHVGPQFAAVVAAVRAQAALLEGREDDAWDLARAGLETGHESSGNHRHTGQLLFLATRAAVARGDATRLAEVVALVDQWSGDGRGATPEWLAWAAMARAEATRLPAGTTVSGPGDPAAWWQALDAAHGVGHRPMSWEAARRLGEALLAADLREDAGAVLLPALAEAEAAGARVAVALRSVARRGRLVEGEATVDLTAREVEVLGGIARGLTNREIGEELFITEKTASTHVSNLLRKLGAANRAEAASMATQRGLVAG